MNDYPQFPREPPPTPGVEEAADIFIDYQTARPKKARSNNRNNSPSGSSFLIFLMAGFGAAAAGAVGLICSQYLPVFGGFIERSMAEPFSPARLSLIPIHLFAFVPLGAIFGGALGWLISRG